MCLINDINGILFHILSQIVFEVYCSTNVFNGTFDKVSINIGNGWSPSRNEFVAPVTGIYYFSFSIGVSAGHRIRGYVKYGTNFCTNNGQANSVYDSDIASRGCLLSVTSGAKITAEVASYNEDGDSSYYQTSFKGFLYSPVQGKSAAWSVHNNEIFSGTAVVIFPLILVTYGITWKLNDNSVVISTAGTYYVEIVGQTQSSLIDMRLILNKNTVLLRLLSLFTSYVVTRSRSALVYLNAGAELAVQCSNCGMTGTRVGGISFQGILLFTY